MKEFQELNLTYSLDFLFVLSFMTFCISPFVFKNSQFTPISSICEIWSSIKLNKGMITIETPESVTADSWKVRLLPPPVGIRAIVSNPLFVAFIISRCFGLKNLSIEVSLTAYSQF